MQLQSSEMIAIIKLVESKVITESLGKIFLRYILDNSD